jgi:tetratricopeptide (TPR) repeat protein
MGFAAPGPEFSADPILLEASSAETSPSGDAASPAALAKLEGAVGELRALAVAPMLRHAIAALRAEDAKTGTEWALKALNQDAQSGLGWYVLAVAREKSGDFANSLKAYQSALALLPNHADLANDLGRLAFRMGMKDVAEQLFRRYLEAHPDDHGTINNLVSCVRDQGRPEEAIDILKAAIKRRPEEPSLWNTLGTILSEQGDKPTALIFFDEALRLDPEHPHARYNRGNAFLEMNDPHTALAECERAIAVARTPDDRLMMQMARSTIKIGVGLIGEGWDDYESRLDPLFAGATLFLMDRPRWTPGDDLAGKHLLVMGEQGLGDEVLFANLLPDVVEALGPAGKLTLAVEHRLVPLFQRSFPTAEVVPHVTYAQHGRNFRAAPALGDTSRFDLWTPLASLLRGFRRDLAAFPKRERFLVPDPTRIAYWRCQLADAPKGRKVGLLWKSMRADFARSRFYSPFELWAPVLTAPGTAMINVQYGDCAPEIEWARRELGVEIWTPPGIDLKNNLDDLAALTCALDVTIGFANATSNISAACGAPTWIISAPGAWTRLGTDHMPWYPQARIFNPPGFNQWEESMAAVGAALASL